MLPVPDCEIENAPVEMLYESGATAEMLDDARRPSVLVAIVPTTPFVALRRPLSEPMLSVLVVTPLLKVCAPVKVLAVYVLGMVVEALVKKIAEVVENPVRFACEM